MSKEFFTPTPHYHPNTFPVGFWFFGLGLFFFFGLAFFIWGQKQRGSASTLWDHARVWVLESQSAAVPSAQSGCSSSSGGWMPGQQGNPKPKMSLYKKTCLKITGSRTTFNGFKCRIADATKKINLYKLCVAPDLWPECISSFSLIQHVVWMKNKCWIIITTRDWEKGWVHFILIFSSWQNENDLEWEVNSFFAQCNVNQGNKVSKSYFR